MSASGIAIGIVIGMVVLPQQNKDSP